jgi:signal transduction histidine kinase
MVTREAIHNVLKHSRGNMIVFEFRKVDEKLNLHIHDNGINETQDIQFSGIGLESIKMRISKIGGKVSFKKGKDGFDIDINV